MVPVTLMEEESADATYADREIGKEGEPIAKLIASPYSNMTEIITLSETTESLPNSMTCSWLARMADVLFVTVNLNCVEGRRGSS
jgi:hypothetical protein